MDITKANENEAIELAHISSLSFDTDIQVGATEIGGPPDYDSEEWHLQMQAKGFLYAIHHEGRLIGGCLLCVPRKDPTTLQMWRIFIHPAELRKGYGRMAMRIMEGMFPGVQSIVLDTPKWNIRTNAFYQGLGYTLTYADEEFNYYKKVL